MAPSQLSQPNPTQPGPNSGASARSEIRWVPRCVGAWLKFCNVTGPICAQAEGPQEESSCVGVCRTKWALDSGGGDSWPWGREIQLCFSLCFIFSSIPRKPFFCRTGDVWFDRTHIFLWHAMNKKIVGVLKMAIEITKSENINVDRTCWGSFHHGR